MQTANERISDRLIRRQMDLLRYADGLSNRAMKMITGTDKDLEKIILSAVARIDGKPLAAKSTRNRLDAMDRDIAALRGNAWREVRTLVTSETRALAVDEAEVIASTIERSLPVDVTLDRPEASELRESMATTLLAGATLGAWLAKARRDDADTLGRTVRASLHLNEPIGTLRSRIFREPLTTGRGAGIAWRARHDARRHAETAVSAAQSEATRAVSQANAWLIEKERFVATLDSRTTPICVQSDGKVYALDEGRFPPLHFYCRSRRVSYISDDALGDRPFNSNVRGQLARRYAKENGFSGVSDRADLPYGQKGRFDTWARRQRRDLMGQVPAATTYPEFFARQALAFQEEVLGVTRAARYRRGDLEITDFINQRGRFYTLTELAKRGVLDD